MRKHVKNKLPKIDTTRDANSIALEIVNWYKNRRGSNLMTNNEFVEWCNTLGVTKQVIKLLQAQ